MSGIMCPYIFAKNCENGQRVFDIGSENLTSLSKLPIPPANSWNQQYTSQAIENFRPSNNIF